MFLALGPGDRLCFSRVQTTQSLTLNRKSMAELRTDQKT
jgi:hypothetical protein